MKLSMETVYEIWDDEMGTHIEVGPDRDGLEMIEIRRYDDPKDEKCSERISFSQEQAQFIFRAIGKVILDKGGEIL